jgi:hypothetical protein
MSQLAPTTRPIGPSPGPYFKVDLPRMTLREYWRKARRPGLFLTLVAMKLLGIRPPIAALVVHTDVLRAIPPARVPEADRARRAPAAFALKAAGFEPVVSLVASPPGQPSLFADLHLGRDRRAFAVVRDNRPGARPPVEVDLLTLLPAERLLATLDHPPSFDPPPWMDTEGRPGLTTAELVARHEARRALLGRDALPIEPGDLEPAYRQIQRRWFQHLIGRGVLLQATREEVAQVEARAANPDGSPPP